MVNKMAYRKYFPLGKAYGEAFCNRSVETQQLVGHIQESKHTLLIAPRRYGKSSLAERAIEKAGLPFAQLNMHLSTSDEEVTSLLVSQTTQLIGRAIGPVDKVIQMVKRYVTHLEPSLSFGGEHAKLQLIPRQNTNYAVVITEALLLLEKLLREKQKKAVLFLDEFQEVSRLSEHRAIEGAFRTAAQEMQQLAIIFSGSIRSMLLSMFEDENRPLYKLCRKIKLTRIAVDEYERHIQSVAQKTWGSMLSEDAFNAIMALSHRHPYYVNYLCDSLWESTSSLPGSKQVEAAWHQVIVEEWSDALKELSELPMGQRRLLKYIANNKVTGLHGQVVYKALSMPVSSVSTAARALIDKDYIEQNEAGYYEVINPLLTAVLRGAEV